MPNERNTRTDLPSRARGSTDDGYAVALQRNGRIVLDGITFNGSNFDFATAQILPDDQ